MRPTFILLIAGYLAIHLCAGCADGIVGKHTNKTISDASHELNTSLKQARDLIDSSRKEILNYLVNNTKKTSRDITLGAVEGSLGYIITPNNRKLVIELIDSLIIHAGLDIRLQLIGLRDSLVSPYFIRQVGLLGRTLSHELIVNPSSEIFNMVIGENTRNRLEALLRMPIPAILNDSALRQICKLRDCLLGITTRGQIASLLDTALFVVNHRLDTPLRATIVKIAKESSKGIGDSAKPVLYTVIAVLVLACLAIFLLMRLRLKKRSDILYYVTREIERFRKSDSEQKFKNLTTQISSTMLDKQLEKPLRDFLYEKGINKVH